MDLNWCRRRDSNSRPSAYEALALPTELRRLCTNLGTWPGKYRLSVCSILPFCILQTHYESDTRLDAKRNPLELLRLSAAQSASLCPAWAQSGAQSKTRTGAT